MVKQWTVRFDDHEGEWAVYDIMLGDYFDLYDGDVHVGRFKAVGVPYIDEEWDGRWDVERIPA